MTKKKTKKDLLEGNSNWRDSIIKDNDSYFKELAEGQSPHFLYIGCSDSRVSPSVLTQAGPGDIFIHRNIGNIIRKDDLSMTAVLEYAVLVLKVDHIILCGHTCCGGMNAVIQDKAPKNVKEWIKPIRKLYLKNQKKVDKIKDTVEKAKLMSYLTLLKGKKVIKKSKVWEKTEKAGHIPKIHLWMFEVESGKLLPIDDELKKIKKEYEF